MRPILENYITKNGEEETRFNPSSKMFQYSIYKARNPTLSDKEVCELCGMDPQLPGRWAKKYGSYWTEWIDEATDFELGQDDALILERVGMIKAVQDGGFSYWKEMAKMKGVIKDEVKSTQVTINTDFTAILAMGDLNAARRRILQELRGVGITGGSGMVDVTEQRITAREEGAGSGASQVQGRPMALAYPLGPDGGRSEQGSPIPAVSEQDSSTGNYEVLDGGEVLVGTKKPTNDLHVAFQRIVSSRLDVLSVEDDDLSM